MDTMKAIRAVGVAVVAAAAMCGTAWGAAPGGKAQAEAKPREKAVARKQVKKVPAARAPLARRAGPKVQARTTRKAAARTKPPVTAARASAARAAVAPREPYWTPLPPSRFYPNGIPELRPEFLHPLPQQQPQEASANTSHDTAGQTGVVPSSGGL